MKRTEEKGKYERLEMNLFAVKPCLRWVARLSHMNYPTTCYARYVPLRLDNHLHRHDSSLVAIVFTWFVFCLQRKPPGKLTRSFLLAVDLTPALIQLLSTFGAERRFL